MHCIHILFTCNVSAMWIKCTIAAYCILRFARISYYFPYMIPLTRVFIHYVMSIWTAYGVFRLIIDDEDILFSKQVSTCLAKFSLRTRWNWFGFQHSRPLRRRFCVGGTRGASAWSFQQYKHKPNCKKFIWHQWEVGWEEILDNPSKGYCRFSSRR